MFVISVLFTHGPANRQSGTAVIPRKTTWIRHQVSGVSGRRWTMIVMTNPQLNVDMTTADKRTSVTKHERNIGKIRFMEIRFLRIEI